MGRKPRTKQAPRKPKPNDRRPGGRNAKQGPNVATSGVAGEGAAGVQGSAGKGTKRSDRGLEAEITGVWVDEPPPEELIRDLCELERLVKMSILTIEWGMMRTDPTSSSAPFDMILGGKWGITKIRGQQSGSFRNRKSQVT